MMRPHCLQQKNRAGQCNINYVHFQLDICTGVNVHESLDSQIPDVNSTPTHVKSPVDCPVRFAIRRHTLISTAQHLSTKFRDTGPQRFLEKSKKNLCS
jgi:hypothetical protein